MIEKLTAVIYRFLYAMLKGEQVPDTPTAFGQFCGLLARWRAALAGGNRDTQVNTTPLQAQSRVLLDVCLWVDSNGGSMFPQTTDLLQASLRRFFSMSLCLGVFSLLR